MESPVMLNATEMGYPGVVHLDLEKVHRRVMAKGRAKVPQYLRTQVIPITIISFNRGKPLSSQTKTRLNIELRAGASIVARKAI
jgi:hypothetical protein